MATSSGYHAGPLEGAIIGRQDRHLDGQKCCPTEEPQVAGPASLTDDLHLCQAENTRWPKESVRYLVTQKQSLRIRKARRPVSLFPTTTLSHQSIVHCGASAINSSNKSIVGSVPLSLAAQWLCFPGVDTINNNNLFFSGPPIATILQEESPFPSFSTFAPY